MNKLSMCFWRWLAFFELTLLFTASHTLLRGIGIHVLDDLLQRHPCLLTCF
jgi:hypothetical protein